MATNNFFTFSRFAQIGCKLVAENKKAIIMRVIVMFAATFGLLCFIGYNIYSRAAETTQRIMCPYDLTWSATSNVFAVLLFCFGVYAASTMMEDLKVKSRRIATLTTPVTPFESWLARWVINVVLFIGVYFLVFFVADCLRTWIFSMFYSQYGLKIEILGLKHLLEGLDLNRCDQVNMGILAYLSLQSFYVMGSSFFPRHALLRTTIVGFFGALIFSSGIMFVYKEFIGDNINIDLGMGAAKVVCIVITVFCWTISYFRFKEIEVIDRL